MALFIILVSALANLALGSLVFRKKPKSPGARAFFVFSVVAAVWILSNLAWRLTLDYTWLKLTYTTGAVFAIMGLIWTHSITQIKHPMYYIAIYIFGFFVVLISFFDNMIVKDFGDIVISGTGYNSVRQGPYFGVFSIYLFLMIGIILWRLTSGWWQAKGLQRVQLGYIALASWIFLLIVIVTDIIVPSLTGSFSLAFVDSSASLILIGVYAYATLKYRLMNVQVLLRQGFIYGIISLFAYATFHLVAWSFIKIFGSLWTLPALTSGLFVALVFVAILPWAKKWVIHIANNWLYANIYNAEEAIAKLTDDVVAIIELDKLAQLITTTISKTFRTRKIVIVVIDENKCRLLKQRGFSRRQTKKLEKDMMALGDLSDIVLDNEIDYSQIKRFHRSPQLVALISLFSQSGIKLIAPLKAQKKRLGFLALGSKQADRIFTKDDVRLMDTFTKQATIAIDNALLYQNLKRKNARLRKLLKLKGEFLTLASHQLRTPVSIIRWSSSYFVENKGKRSRAKAIKIVYEASVRLSKLINDMLLASQAETKEFVIKTKELKAVNVYKLVTGVTNDLRFLLNKKGIKLKLKIAKNLNIIGHDRYLRLVLENLIDNAIKYTPQDKSGAQITIRAEVMPRNKIRINVIDQGVGISKKDQSRIFDKFVRLDNALFSVTQGTGLGLYIVKKVIEAHPAGKYGLESQSGKGANFWVELLATNNADSGHKNDKKIT